MGKRRVGKKVEEFQNVEKVKKFNDSIIDLTGSKEVEQVNCVQEIPIVDLSNVSSIEEVKTNLENLPVEDFTIPESLRLQKLLKPKLLKEFKSEKIPTVFLFKITYYWYLAVDLVSRHSISLEQLKREIIKLFEPIEPLIKNICRVSDLKKLKIQFEVKNMILTLSDVLTCLMCRELNKVKIEKIFNNGSTVKVQWVDVAIFGDFDMFEEFEGLIVSTLEPLRKFSIVSELNFEKCKFCSNQR